MKSTQTDKAPLPGGHYSQAMVPARDLHLGFKIEVEAVAAVIEA